MQYVRLTLASPEDEEFAGLVTAVEVEPAQFGLAAAAVDVETAVGPPGLESACRVNCRLGAAAGC